VTALEPQPRVTLTVASGTQVQQFVVPAVAYVPAAYVPAYAAIRTPDGWIIFQL
jgi:small ligand-binding sensory domain FIST